MLIINYREGLSSKGEFMKLLKMLQSVDILAINGPVDVEIEDISYVLNTPENTVKSHLKRAKESLCSILKEGI